MPLIMEIERFEFDSFERDGSTYHYARMRGHDANGKYRRAICYSPVADEIKRQLEKRLQPGEDVVSHRFMVELEGEFKQRDRESGGRKWTEHSYATRSFKLLTGPSVELLRSKKNANVALNAARKNLEEGDIKAAYLVLEAFNVQLTGQPAPSSGMDLGEDDVIEENMDSANAAAEISGTAAPTAEAAPEERAMARLAARGAAVEAASEQKVTEALADNTPEATEGSTQPEKTATPTPRRMPGRPPAIPARGPAGAPTKPVEEEKADAAPSKEAEPDAGASEAKEAAPARPRRPIPPPIGIPRRGM